MTLPLPPVRPVHPALPLVHRVPPAARLLFLVATIATGGPFALMWWYVEWDTRRRNRAELIRYLTQRAQYEHDLHQHHAARRRTT